MFARQTSHGCTGAYCTHLIDYLSHSENEGKHEEEDNSSTSFNWNYLFTLNPLHLKDQYSSTFKTVGALHRVDFISYNFLHCKKNPHLIFILDNVILSIKDFANSLMSYQSLVSVKRSHLKTRLSVSSPSLWFNWVWSGMTQWKHYTQIQLHKNTILMQKYKYTNTNVQTNA